MVFQTITNGAYVWIEKKTRRADPAGLRVSMHELLFGRKWSKIRRAHSMLQAQDGALHSDLREPEAALERYKGTSSSICPAGGVGFWLPDAEPSETFGPRSTLPTRNSSAVRVCPSLSYSR